MENTSWDILGEVLESFSWCTELSDLLDFEFFGLFLHVFQENWKVHWDFVRSLQVFNILTGVQLLA